MVAAADRSVKQKVMLAALSRCRKPLPPTPPLRGEGEQDNTLFLLPLSVSGRGLGEGFSTEQVASVFWWHFLKAAVGWP